jgi:ABC-type dipeptide/oligopeptide/nickel transport system permease component
MESLPGRPAAATLAAILRRAADGGLTAWLAVSFTFFGLRIVGGDPTRVLLSQGLASPAQVEALRASLGLDRPLLSQYTHFLGGLLRFDFGRSLYSGRAVVDIIAEQLPPTLQLAFLALLLAIPAGLALGIAAAWDSRRAASRLASLLAGLSTSLPVAFLGLLLLAAVAAAARTVLTGALTGPLVRLVLPVSVLAIGAAGALGRVVEAGVSEAMEAPFILAARARGLQRWPHLLRHALRPALPAVISLAALEATLFFTGTVVTETIFARPGLGRLLVSAILQGDYPVAQGLIAMAALLYTASQVAADVLAGIVDPRLRSRA